MRPSKHLFAATTLLLLSAAAFSACGDDDSTFTVPTETIRYSGTAIYPTLPPGAAIETPENLPIPTLSAAPTVTASGLQIEDVDVGTSGEPAAPGDIVYVTYTQWVQGGNQVDRTRSGSIRMRLDPGLTIDGLIEGLSGMLIGGRRILIIPPDLAFGAEGSRTVIPPNATLVYDIQRAAGP